MLRQQRANLLLEKLVTLRVLGIARRQPSERIEREEQKPERKWEMELMHHRLPN